jgi:hypothetical protein
MAVRVNSIPQPLEPGIELGTVSSATVLLRRSSSRITRRWITNYSCDDTLQNGISEGKLVRGRKVGRLFSLGVIRVAGNLRGFFLLLLLAPRPSAFFLTLRRGSTCAIG